MSWTSSKPRCENKSCTATGTASHSFSCKAISFNRRLSDLKRKVEAAKKEYEKPRGRIWQVTLSHGIRVPSLPQRKAEQEKKARSDAQEQKLLAALTKAAETAAAPLSLRLLRASESGAGRAGPGRGVRGNADRRGSKGGQSLPFFGEPESSPSTFRVTLTLSGRPWLRW